MTASAYAVELAMTAARAAADVKAESIRAIDVSDRLYLTDLFVLASGASARQVNGIVDAVEEALLKVGVKPVRREGATEGLWVLLDYEEIIVHVQQAEARAFYALDSLWKDCPAIELPADVTAEETVASV